MDPALASGLLAVLRGRRLMSLTQVRGTRDECCHEGINVIVLSLAPLKEPVGIVERTTLSEDRGEGAPASSQEFALVALSQGE